MTPGGNRKFNCGAGEYSAGARRPQRIGPVTDRLHKKERCEGLRRREGTNALDTSPNPTVRRTLSVRNTAALAFIAACNAQLIFPNGGDVRRFLNLRHVRQSARVIEELIRARLIVRTKRGLELASENLEAGNGHRPANLAGVGDAPALSFWAAP